MTKYTCWDPDYTDEDGARVYYAYDAESAARRYANDICEHDNECYSAYESGVDIRVREEGATEDTMVFVWMQMEPSFRTRLKK